MKKRKQNKELNTNSAKPLSILKKFKLANEVSINEAGCQIFDPISAKERCDIDFSKLKFKKHYDVYMTLVLEPKIFPFLDVHFTYKGIKKLLKTNQKMRDEVETLYSEYFEGDEIEF